MGSSKNQRESAITVSVERIERGILLVRGQKVMLDEDLAEIYGVTTKRLNEQVRRNKGRFPEDFMFRLTREEFVNLRSQFATSRWGGRPNSLDVFFRYGAQGWRLPFSRVNPRLG